MRMLLRTLVCLLLVCATASCGLIYKPDVQQGNLLDKKDVAQLKPGMTKHQVIVLLGTPSVTSPFDQDRWDYLSTFSRRGQKRTERALTLYFNNDVLVRTEGNFFEQNATELLKESKKYGGSYPGKSTVHEDDKSDGDSGG